MSLTPPSQDQAISPENENAGNGLFGSAQTASTQGEARQGTRFSVSLMNLLFLFLAVGLLLTALSSLQWRMAQDTPLLHYAAFMMEKHGAVPYRDIFETSMPITFAFHYAIVKTLGYSDLAFRYVDLSLLLLLLSSTYLFMSRYGRKAAMWSVVVFGLIYFSQGQTMSLQRDYIGIIPIALSLLLVPAKSGRQIRLWRFALLGLLFSLSFLIKPHLGLALPAFLGAFLILRTENGLPSLKDFLKCSTVTGLAFITPVVLAILWLSANSALDSFLDMFFGYLPLHNALSGDKETLFGFDRAYYLVLKTLEFGGYSGMLLFALFAIYRLLERYNHNKWEATSMALLLACLLLYSIYPTFAGKFWAYHYMPLAYFCSIACCLCFAERADAPASSWTGSIKTKMVSLGFVIALTVQLNLPKLFISMPWLLQNSSVDHSPRGGRVDEIASWLKLKMRPGDKVQPLDWTGGSLQAMLIAKAPLATRFMYDYHFYHHVSSPYIQTLRRSLIKEMKRVSPRFVIEVSTKRPWVFGKDTTRAFPALRKLLKKRYRLTLKGDGYRVYELKEQFKITAALSAQDRRRPM